MPRTSETLIEQSKYYDAEAQRAKAVIDAEFDSRDVFEQYGRPTKAQ